MLELYRLFTLRRSRSPLILNGERALLRVNRLYPSVPRYTQSKHVLHTYYSTYITYLTYKTCPVLNCIFWNETQGLCPLCLWAILVDVDDAFVVMIVVVSGGGGVGYGGLIKERPPRFQGFLCWVYPLLQEISDVCIAYQMQFESLMKLFIVDSQSVKIEHVDVKIDGHNDIHLFSKTYISDFCDYGLIWVDSNGNDSDVSIISPLLTIRRSPCRYIGE